MNVRDYILDRCDIENECWLCRIGVGACGYARIKFNKKIYSAHRLAYEHLIGDVPKGYHVHHICENKNCCNPAHLLAVSPLEHKALHKVDILECPNGHKYTKENTSMSRNCKVCRQCCRDRSSVRRKIKSGVLVKDLKIGLTYDSFFPKLIVESEHNIKLANKLCNHIKIIDDCFISTYSSHSIYDKTEFVLMDGRKIYGSHILSWILFENEVYEPGKQVHHLCKNIKCCNPKHLSRLTAKEHGETRKQTHCKYGHEYTYIRPNGWHQCTECGKLKSKERSNGSL